MVALTRDTILRVLTGLEAGPLLDQGRQIMELFKKLNSEGATIIQVTHSETNAAYGNRIIRLRDGWLE